MDLKSAGPALIVWMKGYTDFGGERRNTYKYQKRFYPEKQGAWEHWQTEPFVPRNPLVPVPWMRVMLYAYLSPGQAYFDHVDLRKVRITKGATRKADFEDPTKSPEGWREKALNEGGGAQPAVDPEEAARKSGGGPAGKAPAREPRKAE
jgi:hypothetical protein